MPSLDDSPRKVANKTRKQKSHWIVTAYRYAVNEKIKQKFSYFNSVTWNSTVEILFIHFRIDCAIHNFKAHDASQNVDSIIGYMLQYKDQSNKLTGIIKQENLNFKFPIFDTLKFRNCCFFLNWVSSNSKYTLAASIRKKHQKNSCSYFCYLAVTWKSMEISSSKLLDKK